MNSEIEVTSLGNIEKADVHRVPPRICSPLKTHGEKNDYVSIEAADDGEPQYPTGYVLVFLSLGMMAVVLMVALDNYILGNLMAITLSKKGCIVLT